MNTNILPNIKSVFNSSDDNDTEFSRLTQQYTFTYSRNDGINLSLHLSFQEKSISIFLNKNEAYISEIELVKVDSIQFLNKKKIEVVGLSNHKVKVLIDLDGASILEIEVNKENLNGV